METISYSKEDYNNEPVYYCKNCLSLQILTVGSTDYCDCCGNTEIDSTHISIWEEMYKNKYGKPFNK
jgi:hypothetical protein